MELLESKNSSSGSGSYVVGDHIFPIKPKSSSLGRAVAVYSNFYKFKCNTGGREVLFEYQVKTEPNLTCHSNAEKSKLRKVVGGIRDQLNQNFDNYVYREGFIYSFENITDSEEFSVVEDGVEYSVTIQLHNDLTFDDPKVTRFFRTFLNLFVKSSGFIQVRAGRHFNPNDYKKLEEVNMYKAYFNTSKTIDGAIYLNLNP